MTATLEETLYRSVVDEDFRTLLVANPDLFGLTGLDCPEAVEAEVQEGFAITAMRDVDVQACNNSCSWGVTFLCDKYTN